MKTSKRQKGFAVVEILILITVILVAASSAWYVGNHGKKKTTSPSTSNSSTTNGLLTYENKDLGFKFSYPKSLGAATLSTNEDTKGSKSYSIHFAETQNSATYTAVTMENKDFVRGGIGSVCNLGIALPEATYSPLIPPTGTWVSSRSILSEKDTSATESVSFPEDITGGDAMCPDAELVVLKQVKNANFEAIKVYHSERTTQASKLKSQNEYNTLYASTPDAFISAETRDAIIKIAQSITTQ